MKLPKPAPEAPDTLAQRTAELDAIRAEIAAAEAALPALAQSDDDEKFESASLAIERLKRSELRARKRLEQAQTAHAEAEAREEQERRRSLYEAGTKAHAEGERLLEQYATKAAEIVAILRGLSDLRAPIDAANKHLPDGERDIDWYGITRLCGIVALPAATRDGAAFWWQANEWTPGPLDESRGRTWQPPSLSDLPPPAARPDQDGQHMIDNGARRYVLPPCDFGRPAQ